MEEIVHQQRSKRAGEDTFGIIVLLVGLGLAWQSYEIAGFSKLSSPGAFPLAASAAMVIGSVIVVIGNLRRRRAQEAPPSESIRGSMSDLAPSAVVVFAGCVLGYAAIFNTVGFLPSSFLFLFVTIQFLRRGSAGFNFGVTIGLLLLIYVVFRLVFKVVLPEGIVPEREIIAWVEHLFAAGGQ